MQIVASPDYLRKFGEPLSVTDLDQHKRIGFGYPREIDGWRFVCDGKPVYACPSTCIQASDGETVRRLALKGLGLARLAAFTVRDDIAAGRLNTVLKGHYAGDNEAFHAVYTGQGGLLPARVRALLDFLSEHGTVV
jgi:DNA-binding transcriptional LysR family regulator